MKNWIWITGILGAGFLLFSSFKSKETTAEEAPTYINNSGIKITATKSADGKYRYTEIMVGKNVNRIWDATAKNWIVDTATNASTVVDNIISTPTYTGEYTKYGVFKTGILSNTVMSIKFDATGKILTDQLVQPGMVSIYGEKDNMFYYTNKGWFTKVNVKIN